MHTVTEGPDGDHSLKEIHGRGMNTISEDYKLPGPADEAEMKRLNLQHRMWRLLVRGPYPPALSSDVDGVLSYKAGSRRIVLDVGCGSARWAIDMAEMYPHAQVIGVDLARNFQRFPPSNFEFIQMDITQGLPACPVPGGYDLIHARSLTGHLKDPAAFLRVVYNALKPGGLFILADGTAKLFDSEKNILRPRFPSVPLPDWEYSNDPGTSWFSGWMDLWIRITCSSYKSVDTLIEENGQFSLICFRRYFCPINWEGEDLDHGFELGEIMYENSLRVLSSCRPAILASGEYSFEQLEGWRYKIDRELDSLQMYLRWELAVSVKPLM
ncbi:S-adenosyl-L-methionine-dependent methyltransferase [Mycena sp. CBHHK59/15]|nr:S-adenosyl-L-methionine-dependent methyltransferase [Mycena sp. CBHHK59/15]